MAIDIRTTYDAWPRVTITWSATETETSAYTDVYSGQLLFALIDDGEGDQTNATVYDTQNATDTATARGFYGHVYPYTSATLHTEEAWLPSSMPLPVDHDAAPRRPPHAITLHTTPTRIRQTDLLAQPHTFRLPKLSLLQTATARMLHVRKRYGGPERRAVQNVEG